MMVKKRVSKKRNPETLSKLTETEQDLLWHLEHGYQLETDSLGNRLCFKIAYERLLVVRHTILRGS
jgi:hypothetical protein